MFVNSWVNLALFVVIILAIITLFYLFLIRPHILRLGAADDEVNRHLPGDEFVENPLFSYTQAITIRSSIEKVWPWIVQIGYKRAGWYSYDWIDELMGAAIFVDGRHSSDRIVPELQELKVGDQISISPKSPFNVLAIEPGSWFVLGVSVDLNTGKHFDKESPSPAQFMQLSWLWSLEEIDAFSTRLIIRWCSSYNRSFGSVLGFGVFNEGGAMLMQPKSLKGIKLRAEATQLVN